MDYVKIGLKLESCFKSSIKYAERGAKNVAVKTNFGRKISEGIKEARTSFGQTFSKINGEDSFLHSIPKTLKRKLNSGSIRIFEDQKFISNFEEYAKKMNWTPNEIESLIQHQDEKEILTFMIERTGVGPSKFAQIISNNKEMMSKFTPEQQAIIKAQCSKKGTTRTVEEAQNLINQAFEGQDIKVVKGLSQGTVGEAYLVKKPDGSTAVVKMVKKGIDKSQLDIEEKVFSRLIGEVSPNQEAKEKYTAYIKNIYKDWKSELNFNQEMDANKQLAKGAKRYKVADITDISKDGSCILMNMAHGIQMDKLMEALKDYKSSPSTFATKYADLIKENPWLENPDKVMRDLPKTMTKVFDEQFMFMKKGGKSVMHGDPHMGNYFITADEKGRLIPEFIDTGNCVKRDAKQIQADIKFFSNYVVGNSEGVARYFVDMCNYTRANKEYIIGKVTKELDKNIFGKKQNITHFNEVEPSIVAILEKHGLTMAPEAATAMKAQMQFFSGLSDVGKLTGQKLKISTIIGDVPQALWGMIKRGYNPWGSIKTAVSFARLNPASAAGTAYQFKLNKDMEKAVIEKLDKENSLSTMA
jgi:hypothetical protein